MGQINSFEGNYADERLILKDVIPLDIPLCISLEASNVCNFKCIMCWHNSPQYKNANAYRNMDMNLFRKLVEDIKQWTMETKTKVRLIKLYSLGEPLINPDIANMVRIIKENDICLCLEITSNTSLLSREKAEQFVDFGLDVYRASIYSVIEKKNKRITNSDCSCETIKENLKYMRDYREKKGLKNPFISAKMIDSYTEENEIFKKIYGEIADEAYLDKIMLSDLIINSMDELYYGENVDKVRSDTDRARFLGNVYSRHVCRYPFTHMTVRSDGKVIICCEDWLCKTMIGDANTEILKNIWNGKKMYAFRKMMLETKGMNNILCNNCEIPFRMYKTDIIDDVSVDRFSYCD